MAHISEDTMDADEDGDAELQGASLQAYEREYNDERCALDAAAQGPASEPVVCRRDTARAEDSGTVRSHGVCTRRGGTEP